jgi:hypothetical protein
MRILILSETIYGIQYRQSYKEWKIKPPSGIEIKVADPNDSERLFYSVFDYDVTILHITSGEYNTIGYFRNIPKIANDTSIALRHGRSIICLPQSKNFHPERSREIGEPVYTWLERFGIVLRSNWGTDIKPSGAGRAYAIQEYLKCTWAYFQIVSKPDVPPERRLAVVDDTEILVGLEHPYEQGTLVVLPPPSLSEKTYASSMSRLLDVAMRYYERAQRKIAIGDTPDWVEGYLPRLATDLNRQIQELSEKKLRYDKIAYVLYGTGDELQESVTLLLSEFDLDVKPQRCGANIDLTANHAGLKIGLAIEVTGTKGVINKDSNKVSQAWQYLQNRVGTSEENDRLVIIANTQYHLDPKDRTKESFTPEVVKLLGDNKILLVTALQLYDEWKSVHEGHKVKEDIVKELHSQFGLYTPK